MIPLVPILGLASSYSRKTGSTSTRDAKGKPFAYTDLIRTDALAASNPSKWRAPPGMLRDLLALDAQMKAAGSSGLRATEVLRSYAESDGLRRKYDTWVKAGRPSHSDNAWNSSTMSTAFAARAGESEHNWGGAVDLDVYALDFPGLVGNAQLAKLWEIAKPLGFAPIIAHPNLDQSECWHFDHLGPLRAMHDRLGASADHGTSANANITTAQAGCLLTGSYLGSQSMERLVQARLLLVGETLDLDGALGPQTKAILAKYIGDVKGDTTATILNKLDAARVGFDEAAAA